MDPQLAVEHDVEGEGAAEGGRADLVLVRQELVTRLQVHFARLRVLVVLRDGELHVVALVRLGPDHVNVDGGVVQLAGHRLHDADHDVLQPRPLRVVVQDGGPVRLPHRASEGGSAHARVDAGQVVVQGVEVLQEVGGGGAQHLQDLVVARLLAVVEEHLAEQLQHIAGGNVWRKQDVEWEGKVKARKAKGETCNATFWSTRCKETSNSTGSSVKETTFMRLQYPTAAKSTFNQSWALSYNQREENWSPRDRETGDERKMSIHLISLRCQLQAFSGKP